MENYLMNYDSSTGEIKGFYLRSIHGNNIPTPVVEVSVEKHQFYMENNGKYKINPTTLEDELLPVPEPQVAPKSELELIKERQELIQNAMDELLLGGGL